MCLPKRLAVVCPPAFGPVPSHQPVLWRLGYELSMKLRRDRPDLLHVQYTAPVGARVPVVGERPRRQLSGAIPSISPEGGRGQLALGRVRRTVDRAWRVLTVSEFRGRAILRVYGHLDEDKVVVAPNAAGAEFRPVSLQAAAGRRPPALFARSAIPSSVGDLQPRKNRSASSGRSPNWSAPARSLATTWC